MRRWQLLALLMFVGAGCNRQDVDGLGRIGRKVVDRTKGAVSPLREKLDTTLQGIGAVGLKDRVLGRLAWDKSLADVRFEVIVNQGEVELKGTLKQAEQRKRALELAETTVGVERVTDHLQVE